MLLLQVLGSSSSSPSSSPTSSSDWRCWQQPRAIHWWRKFPSSLVFSSPSSSSSSPLPSSSYSYSDGGKELRVEENPHWPTAMQSLQYTGWTPPCCYKEKVWDEIANWGRPRGGRVKDIQPPRPPLTVRCSPARVPSYSRSSPARPR